MKRIMLVGMLCMLFFVCTAANNGNHYGNGNGNRNSNANTANGQNTGWSDPGEVGGDPDQNTQVPFDTWTPLLVLASVGYYLLLRKSKKAIDL